MLRLTAITLFAALAFAQDPADLFNKPPAAVDEALRARITEFFQYHVTQEFRKAEKLVAEDSQEFFYNHNKPHYLSFEIQRITYSDNFTKAKAVLLCEQFVPVPGFTDKPLKVPTPSSWKLENGQWYWYVDMKEFNKTPWGTMKPGESGPRGGLPTSIPSTPDFVMNQIKVDRQSLSLKPGEPERVTITNTAAGYMDISIMGKISGAEATLDRTQLKQGEKAILTLTAGPNLKAGSIAIRVVQTGEILPIQISVR